jgi:hypothetical protein
MAVGEVDPHPLISAALSRELGRCRTETLPDQEIYFLERGRFLLSGLHSSLT